MPFDDACLHAVAGALVAFLDLGQQSDLGHHVQQLSDDVVGILDLIGTRAAGSGWPPQPAPVLAQAGDV